MSAEILRLTAALLLVGTLGFYIFVFRKEFITFFEETLVQSLKGLFADKAKRALFGVFYKFNHDDAEEWIKWIKSGDADTKERAFDRIVRYISRDSRQLGSVIKDISRAVLSLEHDASYNVFENLLHRSRKEWGGSKSSSVCYEEASLGLMKINEQEAQELLIQEFNEIGEDKEGRTFKRHVLSALSLMKDDEKLTKFYKDVALDYSNEKDLRILTLNLLEDKRDADLYFNYLVDLIKSFIADGIDKHGDMLTVCFERYLETTNSSDKSEEAWKVINDFCKQAELAPLIASALATKIKDKNFKIDEKWLLIIYLGLEEEDKKVLDDVLIYHFTISEKEKELFKIERQYQNFANQLEFDLKANFKDLEPNANFSLYRYVDKLYPAFEAVVDKHERAIRVITGCASKDKIYMAQQYAIKKHQKTMCINADLLMLSPDLVSRIDKLLSDEYKLLYFYNCYEFMSKTTDGSNDPLAKNILALIAKLNMNRDYTLIVSIDKDMQVIEKEKPKLAEALNKGGQFMLVHELGSYDHRDKKEIFADYKSYLKSDRKQEFNHESLDKHTKGKGCIEFMRYMLEAMTKSLITHGKLLDLDKYDEYLAYDK